MPIFVKNNGVFWMSFKDFITNFCWLQVGKCKDDYFYEYTNCQHVKDGFCVQKLTVENTGPMSFCLAQ